MLPGLKDPMDGFPKGWERGNHTNINVALLMGRIIYGDMVYANATGWGYWKGMELDGNHALISLFANEGNIEKGGNVYANKLLWALGNYSLFIRPGYKRIDVSGADNLNDLVASAYISNNKDKIVIVCVNSSFKDIETTFKFPSKTARHINGCKVFCTSSNMDLACIPYTSKQLTNNKIIVKGRSLTTIVFDL
jgi:O-Glycosyl hydrolase family 30.